MSHASATVATNARRGGLLDLLTRLHSIKIGGGADEPEKRRIPRRDLSFLMANLASLVGNGLALPRALAALAEENSLRRYSDLLHALRRKIEAGELFSAALAAYPGCFSALMVHQVRVGERSGTMAETLLRIASQLERSNQLRGMIIKRLSYPLIVLVAGIGVVTFMLLFIVPVFQETYDKSNIPLPLVTQLLVAGADFMLMYGWTVPVSVALVVFLTRRLRRNEGFARSTDRMLLQLPLLGDWFRDMAVYQFMQVLGTMMESGFKLVDALNVSAESVSNREVAGAVEQLRSAVTRGERLSRELERHGDLFPPVVSQLVIVGEKTGRLSTTTAHVAEHLRRQIERKTDVLIGTIEPVLTIGMAAAIGFVLMAIYLPMFDMINVVGTG